MRRIIGMRNSDARHRVLRVITRLNIGGPARQAILLTRAMQPQFETILIAGHPEPGEGELTDPEITVERVSLTRPLSPRRDLAALQELTKRMRSSRFDLVHTHMAKAGTTARFAALRSHHVPKLVHTFHGHVLEGYFTRPVQRVFVEVEKRLARRTDALVAVSEEIRDDLLNLGIGSEDRWRVIPLGFELAPMLEVERHSGVLRARLNLADEPIVGVLGRLAPIKDHVTLLEAVARLDGIHLAVLGDGELRARLQERVGELGIEHRVHFAGWVLDVPAAIADMDVVALTSRNEGTPVSLIEAHACGRPVVATDVGGVRAVVKDPATGFLVPPGDAAAVAAALEKLLGDPPLARRMGAAGREHVRHRFTADRLVSDIRSLYEELLR